MKYARLSSYRFLISFTLVLMGCGVGVRNAIAQMDAASPVTVSAVISDDPLVQGKTARIGVKIVVDAPFHVQSAKPNDPFLIPTSIEVTLPPGIHAGTTKYPVATEIKPPPGSTDNALSVYENRVYAIVPLTVDANAPPGAVTLSVKVITQACNADMCNPPESKIIEIPVTITAAGTAPSPKNQAFFAAADKQKYVEIASPTTEPAATAPAATQAAAISTPPADGTRVPLLSNDDQVALIKQRAYKPYNAAEHDFSLGWIIAFALFGGAILNIMPCVLPVVPLKVLSLVQQAHGDRKLVIVHALAFSAGVISLFIVLAIALKTLGLFYGQQFQSPAFLIAMVMFVIALALSMLNVWTINPPQAIYNVDTTHTGFLGSFTNGLMATLLATPCSAPYLGAPLAWALVQPTWITALTLALVGLGMSIPYLFLAAFPAALEKLPRAGRWSELLKQGLGIVMLGVAVYLITLIPNVTLWPWVLLGAVVVGLVCWGWGQIPTGSMELSTIWTIRTIVLLIGLAMGGGLYMIGHRVADTGAPVVASAEMGVLPTESNQWVPFNVALMDAALKAGRPVVIDWTADWCINCRSLEAFVLSTQGVQTAFSDNRAVLLRADLSRDNPPASVFNEKLGGHAIPVLAIFSPGRPLEPVVLRDSYTPARVESELKNAGGSGGGIGGGTAALSRLP